MPIRKLLSDRFSQHYHHSKTLHKKGIQCATTTKPALINFAYDKKHFFKIKKNQIVSTFSAKMLHGLREAVTLIPAEKESQLKKHHHHIGTTTYINGKLCSFFSFLVVASISHRDLVKVFYLRNK